MASKVVTSRKEFVCAGCKEKLPAGVRHIEHTFKMENGDYRRVKLCENCEKYYRVKNPKDLLN